MANCDPNDLVNAAKCYTCLTPQLSEAIKISLLCQILQNSSPMASCDPVTLAAAAKCFMCLTPQQQQAIQTQLLCEILQGGGGGTSCIVCVDGALTPTDPAPCDCSIAYNQQGQFWFWHTLSASWIPFIV